MASSVFIGPYQSTYSGGTLTLNGVLALSSAAVSSTVPVLLPNGTHALPSLSSTSNTGRGIAFPVANAMDLSAGGAALARIDGNGLVMHSAYYVAWNSGDLTSTSTPDTFLSRSTVGTMALNATTATPAGGSTALRLVFGSTSGFGIYVGSGAPTVAAAQGSLYLRSDGSTVATRLYVNTDGATTWTNFVSGA